MTNYIGKIYYEINSEKCNRFRGAVSEALGIKNFVEKISKEKGYECVGIIRVTSGFYDIDTITISEKNKIVTNESITEHLGKRNNYGIKMLVLVNNYYGFEREMESYLHKREEFTASQRRLVRNEDIDEIINEMMGEYWREQTITLDCYGQDLNGYASFLVNRIEDCNIYRSEYRLFRRYNYGMDSVDEINIF